MTSSYQEHIKNSIFRASSVYLARFIGALIGLLVKRMLGPVAVGSYAFINVIDSYVNYTYEIIRGAVPREIPVLRGGGKEEEVKRLYDSSYTMLVVFTVGGSIVFLAFGLLGNYNPIIKFGFIVYAILNIFQSLANFYSICLSTEKNFRAISIIYFVASVFQHLAMLLLCYFYGYKGYFAALLSGAILSAILYKNSLKINFRWKINFSDVKTIFVLGAPIILCGFMKISFESIDKVVIQANFPIEYFGFYNVGTSIYILSVFLPDSIYGVYIPRYLEHIGSGNNSTVRAKASELTSIMRTIMPLALGIVWVILEPLIHFVLPAFSDGIMPARIYIIGVYFASFYTLYYYYLIGSHQFHYVLYASAITFAFAVVSNITVVRIGWGLNGVAGAFVATQLLYSTLIIFIGNIKMSSPIKEFFNMFLKNILYLLPLVALFIMEKYISGYGEILKTLLLIAIFLAINLPFMISSNRESETFGKLISLIRK